MQLLKREFKQIQNSEWAAHFAVIDDLANVLARDPMSGTMHSRSPCLSALQYNQLIFLLCAFIGMPSNVRADGVRDPLTGLTAAETIALDVKLQKERDKLRAEQGEEAVTQQMAEKNARMKLGTVSWNWTSSDWFKILRNCVT